VAHCSASSTRVGEALRLPRENTDLDAGVIELLLQSL
jgi:hypothetical protein